MALYIQGCDKEIGWLGRVEKQDNFYIIHDVYLFKQEVHITTCEISPEGLAQFASDTFTNDPEHAMEIVNNLRLWGHSHVNMGVSPSGQDNTQIETFKDGNPWFIRVIANKSGEMEFAIYDFENGINYKNVKWKEYRFGEVELKEQIKAEILEKVTEKTYTNSWTSPHANQTWKNGKWIDDKKVTKVTKLCDKNNKQLTVEEYWDKKEIEEMYGYYNEYEDDVTTIPRKDTKVESNEYLTLEEQMELEGYRSGYYNAYVDIGNIFSKNQLKRISKCDNLTDVEVLITTFGKVKDCLEVDTTDIWIYALQKYEVIK